MVIDTSAVLACLLNEPERMSFIGKIEADAIRLMSVVAFVASSFVIMSRRGSDAPGDLADFLDQAEIELVSVDLRQAELAVEAFRRFGRGRHPAALNMGDCFAYALAKATGEPLLFKGSDFGQTDIVRAA